MKDHSNDAFAPLLAIAGMIFAYAIVALVFTYLFTCNKGLGYNLVHINWEKRKARIAAKKARSHYWIN